MSDDSPWQVHMDSMARLIARQDWSATPLGPMDRWPGGLRAIVDLVLDNPLPLLVLWGRDLVQIYNDAYSRLSPEPHPDTIAQPLRDLAPEERDACDLVFGGGHYTFRNRPWLLPGAETSAAPRFDITFSPLRGADGDVAGILIALVRPAGQIASECDGASAEAGDRSGHLLIEFQHQLRNVLSVVRSIIRRTALSSGSVDAMEMKLEGRIAAFSRIQSLINRPGGADGLNIVEIVADEITASLGREGEDIALDGDRICLRPRAALLVGMAIHELASNAVQHGTVGIDGGHISVSWRITGPGDATGFELDWIEESAGDGRAAKGKPGFGTDLLTGSLPYELDAEVTFNVSQDGVRFHLVLPERHICDATELDVPSAEDGWQI
jgi:two-component sensor histidine kinase